MNISPEQCANVQPNENISLEDDKKIHTHKARNTKCISQYKLEPTVVEAKITPADYGARSL